MKSKELDFSFFILFEEEIEIVRFLSLREMEKENFTLLFQPTSIINLNNSNINYSLCKIKLINNSIIINKFIIIN